jgi:hypothetical protein
MAKLKNQYSPRAGCVIIFYEDGAGGCAPKANPYTVTMKQDADWRIGWIKDRFPVWPLILLRREESKIVDWHFSIPSLEEPLCLPLLEFFPAFIW